MFIKKGATDKSVYLRIIDSTDGTPETGVVFNTSGIDLWYRREGAAAVSITEVTLASLTTAHTDGGFLHVGNGVYRLDLPDAAWATGATEVVICGTVTGMIVKEVVVQLVDVDLWSASGININGQIKRNAAFNNYLFYMTDSSTHNYKTGLTVTGTVIIDGAAPVSLTNAPTEIGLGWYQVNLTAADTNGRVLGLNFTGSGADTTPEAIVTVP